ADLHHHLVSLMVGFQADRALCPLADPLAFWRTLDSVAHCVANQMCDGFGDRIQDALVEIRLLSADNQFHLLPAVPGDVTDDTRETAEKLFHRHHTDLHHRTLKVVEDRKSTRLNSSHVAISYAV